MSANSTEQALEVSSFYFTKLIGCPPPLQLRTEPDAAAKTLHFMFHVLKNTKQWMKSKKDNNPNVFLIIQIKSIMLLEAG
jgi:hypothetical protein